MVVPSDAWCIEHNYTLTFNDQGRIITIPDYKKAFQQNQELLLVVGKINTLMQKRGFPLKNMETVIKILEEREADRMARTQEQTNTEVAESPVEKLMSVAKADIIIQLSWSVEKKGPQHHVRYQLQGLDSYTGKQIAGAEGTGANSSTADPAILLEEAVIAHMDRFTATLQTHFSDMFENGREVVLRLAVWENATANLESEIDGEPLALLIEDWLAENTVQSRFHTTDVSTYSMYIEDVRIPLYYERKGRQRAMDTRLFASRLSKYLEEELHIPNGYTARGLGEATIYLESDSLPQLVQPVTDDAELEAWNDVPFTVYVPDSIDMPDAVTDLLKVKIVEAMEHNGLVGIYQHSSRFIIASRLTELSKVVTSTTPPKIIVRLRLDAHIGDGYDGVLFSSTNLLLKGVGNNATEAYLNALEMLNPADARLATTIRDSKKEMKDFYASRCDKILEEAQTFAAQNLYNRAILKLYSVPTASSPCYERSRQAIRDIYEEKRQWECSQKLSEAENRWNTRPDTTGAQQVYSILRGIGDKSLCASRIKRLEEKIHQKLGDTRPPSHQQKTASDTSFRVLPVDMDSPRVYKPLINSPRQVGRN